MQRGIRCHLQIMCTFACVTQRLKVVCDLVWSICRCWQQKWRTKWNPVRDRNKVSFLSSSYVLFSKNCMQPALCFLNTVESTTRGYLQSKRTKWFLLFEQSCCLPGLILSVFHHVGHLVPAWHSMTDLLQAIPYRHKTEAFYSTRVTTDQVKVQHNKQELYVWRMTC